MSLDAETLFERAKGALMAGDFAAAAADARRVAVLAPGSWPVLYLLAAAERESGDTQAARRAFEAALRAAPDNVDVVREYAALLGEMGDLTAAHEAALTATRLAPKDARVWTLLGVNRHVAGDGDAALAALERAVALAPKDVHAVRALAELETDRRGGGLPLYRRAARLDPADPATALGLALARHTAGETEAAMADLGELARAVPGWVTPLQSLAKLAVSQGRPETARAAFIEALDARPADRGLWFAYLRMLGQQDDYAAVLTAGDAARGHLGALPELDAFIAVALDETGDHVQAAALLERLDESGDLPAIVDARVRNLLRTGHIEAAERRAAEGVAQSGRRGLWAYLATAWRMLGDPRSAWLEAPEFVQAVDSEEGAALAAAVAPVLRTLHTNRAAPLGQSARGGSETEGQLFLRREPEIRRLAKAFRSAVEAYAAALPPAQAGHPLLDGPRGPARLSGWSVRLSAGGLHVNHIHPEGWLSSAFYVALPPLPAGTTDGWLTIGEPPKELKLDLEPYRLIEPKPGRLALFPSYAWHGTRTFSGAGERLTVAFDVTMG